MRMSLVCYASIYMCDCPSSNVEVWMYTYLCICVHVYVSTFSCMCVQVMDVMRCDVMRCYCICEVSSGQVSR